MIRKTMMFEADALTHYDNRLFFAKALNAGQKTGEIASERTDTIHQEVAALAHKLITIKVESFSSRSEIRGQIQEAFALASLGLEYACQGDLDKAARLLNHNRIVKFFQIGNTLVDKLVKRSRQTLEKAVLISPEIPLMRIVEREEIPAYNGWERTFLELIPQRKLAIDTAQVALHQVSDAPRPLMSLADLAIVNQQLDYLDYRFRYLQTLPQEKIFDVAYPADTDGDTPRQITTALMVNFVLYREIDFHLVTDDLDHFCDIAYDVERGETKKAARDLLIGWIGHYLDVAEQPEVVKKYAVEYWRYCLKRLETQLQRGDEGEAVDVLRTGVLVQDDL